MSVLKKSSNNFQKTHDMAVQYCLQMSTDSKL